jgi:uncharacterized repeat protein (TIGR02543 family)
MAEFPRQVIISLLSIGIACLLFSQRVVGASDLSVEVTVFGEGVVNGSGSYSSGNTVSLSAVAKPGYVFKGWSGDLAGKENPYVFEVRSSVKAKAHFKPVERKIVYINGQPALAGSFAAKLNDTGRRLLKRRSNRVGNTRVYRRNKVLDDLVSIEWDPDVKLSGNINAQNLSADALKEVSEKKSALKSLGVERQMKDMLSSGNYEYVEPNWLVTANASPTDGFLSKGILWGLRNTGLRGGTIGVDVNAVEAWKLLGDTEGVIVAVIDTGVKYDHKDLAANMWKNPNETPGNGKDDDGNGYIDDVHGISLLRSEDGKSLSSGNPMDDNGHGTHVAGTIGATSNAYGAVGVAWNSKIMALKFLDAEGSGSMNDAIRCIDYAIAHGAKVINASYGGYDTSSNKRKTERDAINRALEAGVVFVAAAGNEGQNNDLINKFKKNDREYFGRMYPASHGLANVISVAAIDRNGGLADFSNYGVSKVDLAAPGVAIVSTYYLEDKEFVYLQGTSMAAPHVAGAAALLLSREPNLTPSQVRQRLIDTVTPLSSLKGKILSGGMLNAHAALLAAPKQNLSLEVTYSPEIPEREGDLLLTARLSAPQPVLEASAQATLGDFQYNLIDNGVGADKVLNDGIYSQKVRAPNLATFELTVTVSATGYEPVERTLAVETIARPPNDSFARALPLDASGEKTAGNNLHATTEQGEPKFESGVSNTVWYTWRPSLSGVARLDTFDSSFDTTLAVYRGDKLSALTRLASNDDFNDKQFTSEISFDAQKNNLYYLQIGVGGKFGKSGHFQIHHPQPTPKKPDLPTILPPVILTKPSDLSKIEGDSMETSVRAIGSEPLRYQWLLNGGALIGATKASYTRSFLSLEDSGEYSIRVSNDAGSATASIVNLTVRPTKEVPANDNVENAEPLIGSEGSLSALTRNATGQPGEPDHAGKSSPLHSVWWKWTAPRDGKLRLDTKGSSFDTTLAAYRLLQEDGESEERRSLDVGRQISSFAPATSDRDLIVTLPAHGFSDGQVVEVIGLSGHSANSAKFLVSKASDNSFSLSGTARLPKLSLLSLTRVRAIK